MPKVDSIPNMDSLQQATSEGADPRIALETTVLSHGLPYPENWNLSLELASIASEEKAHACTTGVIDGIASTRLTAHEIERMCTDRNVGKISLKDLPVCIAEGKTGATTVASTVFLAHKDGIRIMATGGIGGVHRNSEGDPVADESADLYALATHPVTVVCSGPKAILHLEATRERLESYSIPVIGFKTDTMPAFFCGSSPFKVDARSESISEVADLIESRNRLGMTQAILLCVPLPEELAISYDQVSSIVGTSLNSKDAGGLAPNEITPYLLASVREEMGSGALDANLELLRRNTRIASKLAVELASRD